MSFRATAVGAGVVAITAGLVAVPSMAATSSDALPSTLGEACAPDAASELPCSPSGAIEGWSLELQDLLAPIASDVYSAVGLTHGFSDLGLDFSNREVDVYYSGTVPAELESVAERAATQGVVAVSIVPTKYGYAEMRDVSLKLAAELSRNSVPWTRVGPDPSFSHIEITGELEAERAAPEDYRSKLASLGSAVLGDIPFEIVEAEPLIIAASRQADSAPYAGGSRIARTYSSGICTSAFTLRYASATPTYLLTAAHCAQWTNNISFSTGGGAILGTTSYTTSLLTNNSLDATLINLGSTGIRPQIYVDGWNSSGRDTVSHIEPWSRYAAGYLSGSISGTRWYLYRDGTTTEQAVNLCNDPEVSSTCRAVYMFQVVGSGHMVAKGDSGGPLFRINEAGKRHGLGLVSGLGFPASAGICDANRDTSVSTMCSASVWVTPINQVQNVLAGHSITFEVTP